MRKHTGTSSGASGFSLLELMFVLVITLVITGVIFQLISLATARSAAEQSKVDMFQEGREFMDQMSRDLRQAGFPNARNMDESVFSVLTMTPALPIIDDLHAAAGLVEVDTGDLIFEGDVDGSGIVSVIHYHLSNTGTNCPCLQRSQLPKINASPLAQTPEVYQVEVQGVQNSNIFTAYNNGVVVNPLPVTISTNTGATIASVDTVQAMLTLQSPNIDPQTHQKPVTTLATTVRLNNCSQAAIGYHTSCQ